MAEIGTFIHLITLLHLLRHLQHLADTIIQSHLQMVQQQRRLEVLCHRHYEHPVMSARRRTAAVPTLSSSYNILLIYKYIYLKDIDNSSSKIIFWLVCIFIFAEPRSARGPDLSCPIWCQSLSFPSLELRQRQKRCVCARGCVCIHLNMCVTGAGLQ